jgi:hypothetical protein
MELNNWTFAGRAFVKVSITIGFKYELSDDFILSLSGNDNNTLKYVDFQILYKVRFSRGVTLLEEWHKQNAEISAISPQSSLMDLFCQKTADHRKSLNKELYEIWGLKLFKRTSDSAHHELSKLKGIEDISKFIKFCEGYLKMLKRLVIFCGENEKADLTSRLDTIKENINNMQKTNEFNNYHEKIISELKKNQ